MNHKDLRYLTKEQRKGMHPGEVATSCLLAHSDYMDERAEKAEALVKELVEALERARNILSQCFDDCVGTPTERFFQDAANDAADALCRATGAKAETKA